jgi:hypothetical protein
MTRKGLYAAKKERPGLTLGAAIAGVMLAGIALGLVDCPGDDVAHVQGGIDTRMSSPTPCERRMPDSRAPLTTS